MASLEFINPQEAEKILKNSPPLEIKSALSDPLPPNNPTGRKMEYSSRGRFSTPAALSWNYFTVEDVTTLSLSDENDLFPTILTILNNLKDDKSFDVSNMTNEEFLETLIFLKIAYGDVIHQHTWQCKCQNSLPEEEQKFCTTEIDLKGLNFKTIEDADTSLQAKYLSLFKQMTQEEFQKYTTLKYGEAKALTPEQESATVSVKEPVNMSIKGELFSFRFTRIGDILEAQRIANRKHSPKIKKIQGEKYSESIVENRQIRDEKIKEVKKTISKDTVMYSRALSMMGKNGQPLTNDQKFDEWRKFSMDDIYELNDYFSITEFGLAHDVDLQCSFCGETVRRSLQQELNVLELLPLPRSSSEYRDNRKSTIRIII